jgi:hypothetical protein
VSETKDKRFPESTLHAGRRRETARREPGMRKKILDALAAGPMTVPELAEELGMPSRDVLWWLMGCVRYGFVEPNGETTSDGYHKYAMKDEEEG